MACAVQAGSVPIWAEGVQQGWLSSSYWQWGASSHHHSPVRGLCSCLQVQQLERSIGLKDLAMADLEQKVLELEAATYDGVFIWKISDFARKRQEAVAGRTPAIFSPGASKASQRSAGPAAPQPHIPSPVSTYAHSLMEQLSRQG